MTTKPILVHADEFAAHVMLQRVRELRHELERIEYSISEKNF
jgi:hypothetical protein